MIIERLALGTSPLVGIGVGLTERVIEVPWVLRSVKADRRTRVLDLGTAYAPMTYKRLLARQPYAVEVADLNETYIPGVRSHVADMRNLPFATGSFDVVMCISTLEHVGMDNTNYNISGRGLGQVDALRELGRVAPRVLVTVPAGSDLDLGWELQYAPRTFRRVVDEAGLTVERLEVFAHDRVSGWMPAEENSVEGCSYMQGVVAAAAVICAELSSKPGREFSDRAPARAASSTPR
ncbi:MAG TPA: class I SAM-dependent methyltransferase [Solirubrobacteraceae bacterium]|nr:class I SAM-dependent methyltransferase [Solirubrobacteraceae bacterium]